MSRESLLARPLYASRRWFLPTARKTDEVETHNNSGPARRSRPPALKRPRFQTSVKKTISSCRAMCSTLSPSLTPPRSVTGLRPPSSSSQEEVLWNLARHSRGFFALESASLPAPPRLADGQGAFQRERDSRRWRRGSLREGRLSMRECQDRTSGIKAKLSFVSHINKWNCKGLDRAVCDK